MTGSTLSSVLDLDPIKVVPSAVSVTRWSVNVVPVLPELEMMDYHGKAHVVSV